MGPLPRCPRNALRYSPRRIHSLTCALLMNVQVVGPNGQEYRLHSLLLAYHSESCDSPTWYCRRTPLRATAGRSTRTVMSGVVSSGVVRAACAALVPRPQSLLRLACGVVRAAQTPVLMGGGRAGVNKHKTGVLRTEEHWNRRLTRQPLTPAVTPAVCTRLAACRRVLPTRPGLGVCGGRGAAYRVGVRGQRRHVASAD